MREGKPMNEPTIVSGDVILSSGRILTEADLERAAAEAESVTVDVAQLRERARTRDGRPSLGGDGTSDVLKIRLDEQTRTQLTERAKRDHTTPSSVAREAIKAFLEAS